MLFSKKLTPWQVAGIILLILVPVIAVIAALLLVNKGSAAE